MAASGSPQQVVGGWMPASVNLIFVEDTDLGSMLQVREANIALKGSWKKVKGVTHEP